MMLALIAFRFYFNQLSTDLVMILMAQTATTSFYQYKHFNNKTSFLVAGIMSCIAIALGFAALLSEYGVY